MDRSRLRRAAAALAVGGAVLVAALEWGPAVSAVRGALPAGAVAELPFTSGATAEGAEGGATEPVAVDGRSPLRAPAGHGRRSARDGRVRQPRWSAAEIAVVGGTGVEVRDRPRGHVLLRLGATTEFGTARRLGVVERRGRWLGVSIPDLQNGTLGWVDARARTVRVVRTRWELRADLSERTLTLLRAGRPVRRATVAVGAPGSPTPTGRFAVTDKLAGGSYGPYYGCCILALSATQPNLPPGWRGGNRMAIHGTDDPTSIGRPASAGCLRASDTDLRALMVRVPVGAPVVIRP